MSGVSTQHRPDGTFYTQAHTHIQRHSSQTTLIKYTCTFNQTQTRTFRKIQKHRRCHIFSQSILLGSAVTPTYLTDRSPPLSYMHKYTYEASSFYTVSWCKSQQLTFSERLGICLFLLRDSNIAQDAVVVAKGSLTHCPSSSHFCNTHTRINTHAHTNCRLHHSGWQPFSCSAQQASGITLEANSNPLPPLSGSTHLHIARYCPKEYKGSYLLSSYRWFILQSHCCFHAPLSWSARHVLYFCTWSFNCNACDVVRFCPVQLLLYTTSVVHSMHRAASPVLWLWYSVDSKNR